MLFGLPYWLILVIPLGGALLVPLFGKVSARLRDWTPAIFMGIAMVLCWSLLADIGTHPEPLVWVAPLNLYFNVILDPLSVLFAILSSTLCFLIYVYSTEYMAHEGDRDRFFFLMLAFGGGMLTLVLSDSLLTAFIGWEIMGFCSYGLIGFWNDKRNPPETDPTDIETSNPLLEFETEGQYNTHCGTKAFIVTRVGDAFMLAGILALFVFTGNFMFSYMSTPPAPGVDSWFMLMANSGIIIPVFLLIFAGAIGKSGMAPLQIWLPEAMAGPTSVSALIHAATMVKAGIYITARFLITMVDVTTVGGEHAVITALQAVSLETVATFFTIVAIIGAITALMTATMGMVSNELKQILAFSTLSQLGYMMLSLGTSGLMHDPGPAYTASVLHVISHGVFKALLFLSAGGVIHAVHTKYITKMGGLKKHMRKTFIVMWIGVLALAGIPPLSGFWSKDSIIEWTFELAFHDHNPLGWLLFGFAVLAAACTIFYSIRLMGMVFYGPSKNGDDHHDSHSEESHEEEETHEESHDDQHSTPHDPGPAMMVPLYLLAAFTVGAIFVYPFVQNIIMDTHHTWLEVLTEMITAKIVYPGIIPFAITLGALALGGIPGYMIYIKRADKPNTIVPKTGALRKFYNFLRHRWYINEFYYWILNKFLNFADWWKERIDDKVIDGIDFKSASAAIAISTKVRWVDDHLVDGFAEGLSTHSVGASDTSQAAQTGRINDYLAMVIFGIGLMVIIVLVTAGVI